MPVGLDSDGALAALYKVATCPQLTLRLSRRRGAEQGDHHAPVASDAARAAQGARRRLARARMEGAGVTRAARRRRRRKAARDARARARARLVRAGDRAGAARAAPAQHAAARRPARGADSASPADIERRLHDLSNRFRGANAVAARREPVPSAYRVFFRQIGLDPEVVRTPLEAALLQRMFKGGFLARGLLADVLLIGLLDTGVPVWALDASDAAGRARDPHERRGRAARPRNGRRRAARRAARDRRRVDAAGGAVRRARPRARAAAAQRAAGAVRGAGCGRSAAVCRRGAVDVR